MKYLLYSLIFLFSSESIAQQFTISGTVVDEQNTPIAYANVIVMQPITEDLGNSGFKNIKGVSTDEKGFFVFDNLEKGNYRIAISFLGFKEEVKTVQLSKRENLKITLKEDTETLGEVTITSTKPILKKEVDRLVFKVANTALSEGSLLDVLRSTPGVLILDDAITVKNSTPTVYINDRKVNLSASEIAQLLENSPANSIKKVEVITNPPAKYDAESGAVLNIVMSRNLITGYRGNVFSKYTQGIYPRYNAGINQFYKTKKINVNLNYSFTKSKINRENDNSVNYLDNSGDLEEQWLTKNNRNTSSNNHNANLNFDYFIDDSNTLSFSSNVLLVPYYDYRINGQTEVVDNENAKLFNFNANNHSKDEKYNLGFNLDFVHRFKSKGKLAFNVHYTDYDYQRNQNVSSDYFFTNNVGNFSTAFITDNNQDTNIISSQIDYDLPIDESSDFSFGLKSSAIKTNSNIAQFDINQGTGTIDFNAENSNVFDYEETIFAAYTSYNKSWDKWRFSGGLRLEQTNLEGLSVSDNVKNTQDYFELFPTLNLSHQASEKVNVYTNYKRSLSRPSYQLLNPFNFFLNDNTIVTGNPNILPSFSNHFVVGTEINKLYTIEAYYKDSSNEIVELPRQDNTNNLLIYSPTNIGNTKELGFDFITYFDVKDNWSVYFVTSFYNIQEEAFIDNQLLKMDQWSNYSELSNNISLLKDRSLKMNFTLTYASKNQQGFQIVDSRLISDLSFSKSILKKKATLSLAFADLFNKQDFAVRSKFGNQDNRNFTNLDNRYVKLGFNYKFGNTTLRTNERTKELNERDRLEKN
ncbi:outer membrane beta-barrel protein [Lacinutrix sp. Bg11-31]|uniref:outer membrane beta-barrel protein n=1 Tax=Lacinutrix sp. Bg11-31 TaxID=2057808 RepID=UPI000C3093D1|nr:outer membrane beta-barrel family protein [Lacinutrix sp. Bg11-31]AUC83010.1 glucosamine-6-phosphate deaminase [Lacinutrix sp. Bg11-31]